MIFNYKNTLNSGAFHEREIKRLETEMIEIESNFKLRFERCLKTHQYCCFLLSLLHKIIG